MSAQANRGDGKAIASYKVLLDHELIYENKLSAPIEELSIETNLQAPFYAGVHTLQLEVDGAGAAEVKELSIYPSKNASLCDPFSRTDGRVCQLSNSRGPLQWRLTEPVLPGRKDADPLACYSRFQELYGRNLQSIEADVAEAVAIDGQGNVYAASHSDSDVDLRKYAPDGSLVYASLIRSCGDGFLSVTGLAIDDGGRVWIAGNTTACLQTTPHSHLAQVSEAKHMRGFVILVDTTQSPDPVYATYLAETENRIEAIRIDGEGNAYVAGTAASLEFPHDTVLTVGKGEAPSSRGTAGFVSVINPAGSGLLWSTAIRDARLTALVLDRARNVYVTGRAGGDVLVAELSDGGRRLSYLTRFGGSETDEGRAISISPEGAWVAVAGDTESADFPAAQLPNRTAGKGSRSFVVALQACKTGNWHARLLPKPGLYFAAGIVSGPALDAWMAQSSGMSGYAKQAQPVPIAPPCR